MDSPWYRIGSCNLAAISSLTLTDHSHEQDAHGYDNIFLPAKDYETSVKLVPNVNCRHADHQNPACIPRERT